MKKVSVIGLFCTGKEVSDGQSIKTRIVAREIEEAIGSQHVNIIDTHGWKKHPWRLFFNSIKAVFESDNVVFLTDAGGIKVFPWLLTCANAFAKRKVYYIVVGGWLVHYIKDHKVLASFLKKLNGIFVETQVMRKGLESLGFKNAYIVPNFKRLNPLTEKDLPCSVSEPYRFCIFSRIMREKGIESAIVAVRNINHHYGKAICTLDLYGQVDSNQIDWFDQLLKTFPAEVQYRGIIPFDKSVEILKDYYALLFPTKYYTEGIPGTIIDAYAAGLPVIASEWESVFDILEPGVTGISYPFDKSEDIQECMMTFIEKPEQVLDMKKNCLKKAEQYFPNAVMNEFISEFMR